MRSLPGGPPTAGLARGLACLALLLGWPAWADADDFARCAACHLADGAGVPGMFPPLAGHVPRFFDSAQGRSYLARLVTRGGSGEITVEGVRYSGGMPGVVADLSDARVAALLNGLARRFAPGPPTPHPFLSSDVAAARGAQPLSGSERLRLRRQALDRGSRPPRAGAPILHAAVSLGGKAEPAAAALQARRDWMLHCQGCHGARGEVAAPGMPALRGRMAALSGPGRDRLVRVPGVANSSLPDERIAATLNWMLATFDDERPPAGFLAFTGEEVAALRRGPHPEPAHAPDTGPSRPEAQPDP